MLARLNSDLINAMVDNLIDGVYANVTRINPETLSPVARGFLKSFRENLREHKRIDKNLANLLVKTLIKYHNDTGESLIPKITELSTVAFFVIHPYRDYAIKVAEFIIFGAIFSILTISDQEPEITDLIEQTIISIMTNPIYEFTAQERLAIIGLLGRISGYLQTLDKFSNRFTAYLPLINKSLREGMVQALEICNASAEEINYVKDEKKHLFEKILGSVFFVLYLAWPMFNITSSGIIKWLNSKTGIELWPQKNDHF